MQIRLNNLLPNKAVCVVHENMLQAAVCLVVALWVMIVMLFSNFCVFLCWRRP